MDKLKACFVQHSKKSTNMLFSLFQTCSALWFSNIFPNPMSTVQCICSNEMTKKTSFLLDVRQLLFCYEVFKKGCWCGLHNVAELHPFLQPYICIATALDSCPRKLWSLMSGLLSMWIYQCSCASKIHKIYCFWTTKDAFCALELTLLQPQICRKW